MPFFRFLPTFSPCGAKKVTPAHLAVEEDEADEEDLGLVILKSIMVDGEEQLSTLDSDEELDRVYDLFMEQLMADEEEDS